MHIKLNIRWCFDLDNGGEIEPGLFRLLENIRHGGTLKQAAKLSGYSYRHAWGMLKHWEKVFQAPLVKLERGRGRGAHLTALGDKLLWANGMVINRTSSELTGLAAELDAVLSEYIHKDKQIKVRLYASHGIAITAFNDLLHEELGIDTDFQIHGSLESLRLLDTGQCNMAGFHIPSGNLSTVLAPQYRRWLEGDKYHLIRIATRNQGLLVHKGNPKKITGLGDLTRRNIRFINRQRESGTRTIFDQLLVRAGLRPSRVNGYKNEEFTHVAVAAMVASGAADVGFGIQAAAAQFGLDFIPILKEMYFIAVNKQIGAKTMNGIKKVLKSQKFRKRMAPAKGYDVKQAGASVSLDNLFS